MRIIVVLMQEGRDISTEGRVAISAVFLAKLGNLENSVAGENVLVAGGGFFGLLLNLTAATAFLPRDGLRWESRETARMGKVCGEFRVHNLHPLPLLKCLLS